MSYFLLGGGTYDDPGWKNSFKGRYKTQAECLEQVAALDWFEIVDEAGTLVDSGEGRDHCKHSVTYEVRPLPVSNSGIIASGMDAPPGVYCRDCGKYVGPNTSEAWKPGDTFSV